jgi:hypothetical protein
VLQLSPDEIRSFQFKKPKRKYSKVGYSPEDLVRFLKEENIHTLTQLKKLKKKNKPTFYAFLKLFGSWSKAQEEAFGKPPVNVLGDPPGEKKYIIDLIHQYKVRTISQYYKLRRERPDMFPSSYHIYKLFGGFKQAKLLAERYTVGDNLDLYARLRRKFKRRPTSEECRRESIDLEFLTKFFGSRKKMDEFVDEIEGVLDENNG